MKNPYSCSYDNYGFRHLPSHLAEAGRGKTLRELLLDFDWLVAKVNTLTPQPLIEDYDLLPDAQDTVLTQAQIVLQVNRFDYGYPGVPAPGTTINCGVYQVTEPWNGSTTWDWANNPDIITSTAHYTPILFEQPGTYTVEVTGFVQAWVNGQPNYGLMVGMYPDPDEVAQFTAVIYGPATVSEALRPRLDIVYQAPTPIETPTPIDTPTPTDTPLPTKTPSPTATRQPDNPPAPTAILPTNCQLPPVMGHP